MVMVFTRVREPQWAVLVVLAALAAFSAGATVAAAENDPGAEDWPCPQHRVERLSAAQVWDGPPIEALSGWESDPAIAELLPVLASRRVPVTEAAEAVKKYAESVPEAGRDEKLTLLFAGLFSRLNAERTEVVHGIGTYQKRQKARAAELEREGARIAGLEAKQDTDAKAAEELEKLRGLYAWNARVFEERQKNIPLACEIPGIIEQRLFELAREIRSHMKG